MEQRCRRIATIESDTKIIQLSLTRQEIISVIRQAGIDKIYFIVSKTAKDEANGVFEIKIPPMPEADDSVLIQPNPLALVAALDEEGKITLNDEPQQSPEDLIALLKQVFRERETVGIFMQGTNQIEKTTFIKASPSVSYGEIAKLIDAVNGAGATSLGLQFDLEPLPPPTPPRNSNVPK